MEERKEKKRKEKEPSLKLWVTKIVLLILILTGFMYCFDFYFNVPVFVDTLVAFIIVLSIGFTHEALHYYQAVKLGYKPKWYRTKIMMGFEISHKSARGKWIKDKRKISILPYVFLIPLSILILYIGLYYNSLGVTIAGISGILLHIVSFPFEGKSV